MSETTLSLIILGARGNCIDVLDAVQELDRSTHPIDVLGFLDDDPALWGSRIHGIMVLGGLERASEHPDACFASGLDSPDWFGQKPEILARTGVPEERFIRVIHPSASISRLASLGPGVVVLQNAVVASGAELGSWVTVLPTSVISHDVRIGSHTCVAGGVVVSGGVTIGNNSYVGANAVIRQNVTIGSAVMIGMGSVVLSDVADGLVVAGNPARPLLTSMEPRAKG